jgi:pimeloyl-ACP methyl ester carboxylesterase
MDSSSRFDGRHGLMYDNSRMHLPLPIFIHGTWLTVGMILSGAFVTLQTLSGPQTRTRELVRYDNVSIEVITEGRGPLIFLLPSLGRDADEFDEAASLIAGAGFRVLRPQPRGFGRSAGPMESLTLHDFARDIAAIIKHENAGPAILAGHAYGHFVAKMTAVDFPELVRGVVLIGAAQKNPNPEVQKSVGIATDPSQPEAERIKHLQFVFFAPGNDARSWLTGFHANVRAAQVIARDSTPTESVLVRWHHAASRYPR